MSEPIASLRIEYVVKREEGKCCPELKEIKVFINPKYADRKIVKELEWDSSFNSSTTFSDTSSVTDVQLDNGEWAAVVERKLWVMYSNAEYVEGRLVESCETGEMTYELELYPHDEESAKELSKEYGYEEPEEPMSIIVYLLDALEWWMEKDDYLKELNKRYNFYAIFEQFK